MPFLWSVVASQGQIYGNRDLRSDSHVINGLNFSYPGYAETLTGIADARVNSNDNVPNPNQTVFAWLNSKPEFAGKVAAFGAWGYIQRHLRQGALRLCCECRLRSVHRNSCNSGIDAS